MITTGDVHLSLPPERFYWALLDAESMEGVSRVGRRDAAALGYLFENVLPVPIEQVQAVYALAHAEAAPACILACGMPRDRLNALTREHAAALTLTPQTLPEFLMKDAKVEVEVDVDRLNLLIGDFEPLALRRAKRRLVAQAAAFILLISAVVIAGLQRRTAALHRQISALATEQHEIIAATIGPSTSTAQPPELRMLAELRSLQQTRGQHSAPAIAAQAGGADVLASFASLVGGWPRDLHIRTESVLITSTSMTVRGLAPSSGDVQTLANALTNLDRWQLEQPQISAARGTDGEVQATLQWRYEPVSIATTSSQEALQR